MHVRHVLLMTCVCRLYMPEVVPEVLTELQHDIHTHAHARARIYVHTCLPVFLPFRLPATRSVLLSPLRWFQCSTTAGLTC
jgi:hypothetical protein